jgi:predicted DNA binding CopG/RHH family protein
MSTPADSGSPDAFASLLAALAAPAPGDELEPAGATLREDTVALSHETALSDLASGPGHGKRTASITIRMTGAEYGQLKQRAAEAGLTVSAYLRSCTLEAESLRAQVKQALATIRGTTPEPTSEASTISSRRWWQFSRPVQRLT